MNGSIAPHPIFPDVRLLSLPHFEDDRGFMSRIYDRDIFNKENIVCDFVQTSHSHTGKAGVLRGIFVSLPPFRESKVVRILNGRMQWVLVDLRLGSSSFGRWGEVVLDGRERNGFFAPAGFAHGCLCLQDSTDLILLADHPFSPQHSTGIRWDDPALSLGWRLEEAGALQISSAHSAYPSFEETRQLLERTYLD